MVSLDEPAYVISVDDLVVTCFCVECNLILLFLCLSVLVSRYYLAGSAGIILYSVLRIHCCQVRTIKYIE